MRRCRKRNSPVAIRACLLLGGLFCGAGARADSLKTVPLSAFAQQMASAQQLVAACAANAGACEGNALPDPEQVEGSPSGSFRISWQWLRDDVSSAKSAKTADRLATMRAAQTHLVTLAAQAGAVRTSAADFSAARKAASAVLARSEFRASVEGPTWTERQLARIQDWILRLFTGMDKVGRRAPWLAPLIEWSCFILALAGLLWFVRQNLARQSLRIALSDGVALAGRGERDSADWARMAEERAAAGDWREAVHCLYWAAIALMEGRRAWRPNVTRTPREYVRLLKPGAEAHRALRELTRSFERVWYGQSQAGEAQYRTALESFRALEASKPERATASEPATGAAVAAVGEA